MFYYAEYIYEVKEIAKSRSMQLSLLLISEDIKFLWVWKLF